MAAEAALGVAFGELLKLISTLGELVVNFNPVLKDITSKLNAITPLLNQIEELNESLDYPKEETRKLRDLMEEGKRLILHCRDVKFGKLDYLKKPCYTKKLRGLDAAIRSFLDVLMLQMARDQKKTLKMMTQMMERVDLIAAPIRVPVPLVQVKAVGLEKAVEELKAKLLKNGVQMLVITAPGGFGKTTLALEFCHDNEVKDMFQGKILFVSFTRKPPDSKLIMKNIIESIRGIQLPDFQNVEHAFSCLVLWLKQTCHKPILIVLDDVWTEPESEYVLAKLSQIPCCKIVVTSRFYFKRFSASYFLEPLSHENAVKLFHSAASLEKRCSDLPDEETVEKIIGRCNGIPLCLKIIGSSLSGRPSSDWKSWQF